MMLCIDAITPAHEIYQSIKNTIEYKEQGIPVTYPEEDIEKMLEMNNFSGETSTNFFYKYLAK